MKSPKTFKKVPSTPTLRDKVRTQRSLPRNVRGSKIGNATRSALGHR